MKTSNHSNRKNKRSPGPPSSRKWDRWTVGGVTYVRTGEAMQLLHVNRTEIFRLIGAKSLHAFNFGPRTVWIPLSDVEHLQKPVPRVIETTKEIEGVVYLKASEAMRRLHVSRQSINFRINHSRTLQGFRFGNKELWLLESEVDALLKPTPVKVKVEA